MAKEARVQSDRRSFPPLHPAVFGIRHLVKSQEASPVPALMKCTWSLGQQGGQQCRVVGRPPACHGVPRRGSTETLPLNLLIQAAQVTAFSHLERRQHNTWRPNHEPQKRFSLNEKVIHEMLNFRYMYRNERSLLVCTLR